MGPHGTNFKPARGTAFMARKDRRADRVQAEQRVMRDAKKRDHSTCRWPGCKNTYRGLTLPVDSCHAIHRGPGGNPDGSRTASTSQLVALCRRHHQLWDAHEIDLQPLTDDGFDGLITFHEKHPDTGVMTHIATEWKIGVSVAVGR